MTRCISIAHFSFMNYKINFMYNLVYYLSLVNRHLLQPHYTGGKILVTKNYVPKAYFYDVNSMYPYALTGALPCKFVKLRKKANLNTFFGFVCVTLETKPKNKFYCNFTKSIVFS